MWESFIQWIRDLFGISSGPTVDETNDMLFRGWIKDDADPRDQIFKGDKS